MKNERGFTLVEMLVVLLIISILILVTIPNVTRYSGMIDEKGCAAYLKMLDGQMETYKLTKGEYPTDISQLAEVIEEADGDDKSNEKMDLKCPGGGKIVIDGKRVIVQENNAE